MTPDRDDSWSLSDAVALAAAWHGAQTRKGTSVPYLSHLLQVAGLVLEHGGSIAHAVAGLLHDSLEDAPPGERAGREREIEERFGTEVLAIVRACTDTGEEEHAARKRPWRARKEHHLSQLRHETPAALRVAACDKRHNLAAMLGDIRAVGLEVMNRFRGSPAEQLWYYGEMLALLRGRIPTRLEQELDGLLRDLRAVLGENGGADPTAGAAGGDAPDRGPAATR
jgi:(p)ppGpp synthase/HD superfamily hydrolase